MRNRRTAPAHPELYPRLGGAAHRDAVRDGRPRPRLGRSRRLRRPGLVAGRARRVSLLDVDAPDEVAAALAAELGRRSTVGAVDTTVLLTAGRLDDAARRRQGGLSPRPGRRLRSRPDGAQGRRTSPSPDRAWGLPEAQGWQGVGHTRMATESAVTPGRLPPLRRRAPTSAWCTTARSPTTPPSGATSRRRSGVRQRERHRGRRAVRRPRAGRGPRRRRPRSKSSAPRSTASTPCWSPTATRSPWSATRSPASPPSSPRPTTGSPWPASTARWRSCRASRTPASGSPSPR